jgi:hypothetical protein
LLPEPGTAQHAKGNKSKEHRGGDTDSPAKQLQQVPTWQLS